MSAAGSIDEATQRVLEVVRRRRGLDLRDRLPSALTGVVGRLRDGTGDPDAATFLRRLEDDSSLMSALVAELLVGTTDFFRDPMAFAALGDVVLPTLLARLAGRRPLRVWAVGVSTGEEAWTLAMLLLVAGAGDGEVLATDLDPRSVGVAERGRYRSVDTVPPRLRDRYWRPRAEGWEPTSELRARVTFTAHDLLGPTLAPPAAVLACFDLVVCRNLLIWLEPRLQRKAMDRLFDVLTPGGALLLGPVDRAPPDDVASLWPEVAREHRVYVRGSDR